MAYQGYKITCRNTPPGASSSHPNFVISGFQMSFSGVDVMQVVFPVCVSLRGWEIRSQGI
jgi:hypothetical protein